MTAPHEALSGPEVNQNDPGDTTTPENDSGAAEGDTGGKQYDAEYVAKLKAEAIEHRQNAKGLAQRLHAELVRATGRLADPADLAFDSAHLESPEALSAAIDELLAAKPHFASRTPNGSVGQGVKAQEPPKLNLMAELKKLV